VSTVSRGFKGRRRPSAELPPGQYLVEDFPVLSAGPTPSIDLEDWELTLTSETGDQQRWDWDDFRALPSESVTVDIHCVTHWSKLGTTWEGVSLDTLLGQAARWGCRAHPAAPSPCQRRVGRLPCPRPRRPVRALVGTLERITWPLTVAHHLRKRRVA
jgi:hypothetical protein